MTHGQEIILKWLGPEFAFNRREKAREKCVHDWTVKGYSYVAPSRDPYDRPEWVFLKCPKCGEEMAEEFS